jgi:hypothetical protein
MTDRQRIENEQERQRIVAAWAEFYEITRSVDRIAERLESEPHRPGSRTTGMIRRLRNRAINMRREIPLAVAGDLGLPELGLAEDR